jgi:dCMP deaminase
MNQWNERFLALAYHISTFSKDPSTKVGALIVRPDKTIVSMGYNGFPRGCNDDPEMYADRETKYARVVHAEVNAIVNAREPLHGYTLYVTPLHPCVTCAGIIIQSGIKCVVASVRQDDAERWKKSMDMATAMFLEAGVEVCTVEQWRM